MTTLGNIEHFNTSDPSGWEAYQERVEFFLVANNITDNDKKKAVFLSLCGPSAYEILRSLIAPVKVKDKHYDEIIQILSNHFAPRTSEIVNRFRFYRRDQQPGESFSIFLKELRQLAEKCGFDAALDTMLRDRIVCGIRDEALQRRLLAEDKITLKRAQEMCLAQEVAARSVAIIQQETATASNAPTASNVNRIDNRTDGFSKHKQKSVLNMNKSKWKCYRCDNEHSAETCVYKTARCRYCEKEGHIERACLRKKKQLETRRSVNIVEECEDNASADNSFMLEMESQEQLDFEPSIKNLQTHKAAGKFTITVKLNNKPHTMEVDSGAAFSVIGQFDFQRLFSGQAPII